MRDTKVIRKLKKVSGECVNCGSKESVQYHHIVPLCFGGNDVDSNIVALCQECHAKAHGKVWKAGPEFKTGRKPKITYEQAEKYLKKYFKEEIGASELKQKMCMGDSTKIKDNVHVKRYMKEHNISGGFYNHVDILESAKLRKTV